MASLRSRVDEETSEALCEYKQRLLNHWSRMPAATDTAENIARRWLFDLDLQSVRMALAELMRDGIIAAYSSGDHTFYFAKDYARIRLSTEGQRAQGAL